MLALIALAMTAAVVVALRYGGVAHYGAYLHNGVKPNYVYEG
jgi:hypothetical protein